MTPSRYDIYVRSSSGWRRHDSAPGDDKNGALAAAAGLDASSVHQGVRVMAVTEYEGRPPLETLAWISPHLSKVASVSRQMREQATAAERAVADIADDTTPPLPEVLASRTDDITPLDAAQRTTRRPRRHREPELRQTNGGALVGKLSVCGLISLAVAVVVFVPLVALSEGLGARFNISPLASERIAVGLSFLVFAVTASVLMRRAYIAHEPIYEPVGRPVSARRPSQSRPDSPVSNPVPPPMPSVIESAEASPESPTQPKEPEPVPQPGTAGGLNQQMRRHMLKFLAGALSAIKDDVPKLNRHVQFGLNLFMSGAAERYGEQSSLTKMQAFVLVREMVEALGNSPDRVDAYCRQYAEYKAQDSYRMIMEAGRRTMDIHNAGTENPFADFAEVMRLWTSNAAARAQAQGVVCIMFTDIVGSTQMTHERGDYGAQEVVRIHNAIVRSALAAHHGREVKHTGDGIMASFQIAANAIRAAQEILEALRGHNGLVENLPVNIRIGLNAGEAVEEEDDFFGTTVQIAARVCDKAGTGEVFVTENVRDLSLGQGIHFEEAGAYEMKGVPEPMRLFRVPPAIG